jgi:CheY-like chemotaxis protein
MPIQLSGSLTILARMGAMQLPLNSILLLAKSPDQAQVLSGSLRHSSYSVAIASSEVQAMEQISQQPFLVILAGDHRHWSETLLRTLRYHADVHAMTLVALTDFHAPSWIYQEENPGFDGFLVNPISQEILLSLVESAHTRQMCAPVA